MKNLLLATAVLACCTSTPWAQTTITPSVPQQNLACNQSFTHERCSYQSGLVGNLTRHGIVCMPANPVAAPMVLVYHGHGSCSFQMALNTRVHDAWPQAMVIYPDGLPGVATYQDPSGQDTGWQLYPNQQDNRDVLLTQAAINYFSTVYKTDTTRVYAMGHSNGSRFVGVLWATQRAQFRAFVFNAAQAGDLFTLYRDNGPARPLGLTMGKTDCVVPYNADLHCGTPTLSVDNYQEASINLARHALGIAEGGTPTQLKQSEFGSQGKELGLYIHSAGHEWPTDQTDTAVRFMQRN